MHAVAREETIEAGSDVRDGVWEYKPRFQRVAYYALLLFCAVSALRLAIEIGGAMTSAKEAGYGDNYIFHGTQQYLKTGHIYPDVSNHDELPSLYSPFLYITLSLPLRFGNWGDSYVGPRLMVLASFLACLVLIASISRKLTDCSWAVAILLG